MSERFGKTTAEERKDEYGSEEAGNRREDKWRQ